ncbi:PREDICTED: ankyrin repeat-containing protein At5g02620-like [Ipomoea nil]|uniref:ankyrin repeat-containing protein At5g02620-like n=1 Tax=Ipomoea nil TaxID=35883 RepID=UPI000901B9DB|nr:PREDICTED: ankyrin repeat-containing protein At5g02620-like [Ipomoea nil]
MKRISSLCGSQKAAAFPRFTDVENQPPHSKVTLESSTADRRTLHGTAKEGDWGTAELILKRNLDYARQKITKAGETLLHVAVAARRNEFVEKLVKMLDPIDLELRNDSKRTAFVYAIELGEKRMAEVMVEKNKKLLTINAYEDMTPLEVAALTKQNEMFSYLFKVTPCEKLSELGSPLMEATIQNDMYDMALEILEKDETLATSKLPCYNSFLSILVRKPPPIIDEHPGGTRWGNILRAAVPAMEEKYLQRKKAGEVFEKICNLWLGLPEEELTGLIMKTEILHYAAMEGNAEFIAMVLRRKPVLSLVLNKKGQTMFHVAVSHRQERVFNLIYDMGPFKELIQQIVDEDGNNILHLTAMLGQTVGDKNVKAKSELVEETQKILPRQLINVSGAALQLQREILWFREVKRVVPPTYCKMINASGRTPEELFLKEHKELIKEGEQWMRDTANSCMIVATLIATMVFAAAFTVPGGYDQVTGIPILIKPATFTLFAISDAVAMFCSIMAIIMFLAILTSRYRKHDFRVALPAKLLIGLTALFVSIVGMLVAFAAAFFLVYKREWEPKLVASLAGVPFASFLYLNWQLWFDSISSIFGSKSLFRPNKLMVYGGMDFENH